MPGRKISLWKLAGGELLVAGTVVVSLSVAASAESSVTVCAGETLLVEPVVEA